MNTLVCTGLDGANPLHMLAALGLLRLADRIAPGARLGWRLDTGAWQPTLATAQELDALLAAVAGWLNALARTGNADPEQGRRVRNLATSIKKAREAAKAQARLAKDAAKKQGLRGDEARQYVVAATAELDRTIVGQQMELTAAREALANSLGAGIAHLGEVISVDPGIFRRAGQAAVLAFLDRTTGGEPQTDDPVLVVSHLPALACDQVVQQGRAVPTRFSFGNGAGGQCLLKDFRALAGAVNAGSVKATLLDSADRFAQGVTGLNWDPAANRSYALGWRRPEMDPKQTDVAANALAYVGLGLLTAVPAGGRLTAVGWSPDDGWTWPLWESLLPLSVVRALLADADLARQNPDRMRLRARGVAEVRRSDRVDPTGQGRPYFAPSRPV